MGFIEDIAKYVQKYAPQYGIKVCSPIIAQAVLESASGTSELGKVNNFFGLKYRPNRCPSSNGIYQKIAYEQNADGSYSTYNTDWFKFPNMDMGVKGYFDFINISNYANLKGITDPRTYLETIKADKYATSKNYVQNVMNVVVKYNLTQYDTITSQSEPSNQKNNILIAIDAGHGSNTGGKRTPDGYREHWANVKVASYFAKAMERCGINYIKVAWDDENARDDEDVALSTRQKQISNAKCDYSISFHFNASGDGKSYNSGEGVETLISNKYPKDSKRMAECIQAELVKGTPQKNRGVKTQSLAMCNCSVLGTKASVLVECAFMTNKRESDLMKSDSFCMECAEDSARGFCKYVGIEYVENGKVNIEVPTETQKETVEPQKQIDELYRVRKSWTDSASQIGAYSVLENARKYCPVGYSIFDSLGNVVFAPFVVKIIDNNLNIRKTPNGEIVGQITDNGKYTIIETQGSWGRLKSGVGWICISDKYAKKI